MIDFAAARRQHLVDTDPDARAAAKGRRSAILWFTGLSGAGKPTIANFVDHLC